MPSIESAGAIVLAGGRSRRFEGGEKALATVGNRTLLARVLDAAGAVTGDPPIVAVAADDQRDAYADALEDPIQFVTDAPGEAGPLAGLRSAVESARAEWLLVLGCDMPLIEPTVVEWLAEQRIDGTDAVVPRTDDGLHPLHAWYRRDAVATALEVDQVDRSLHALLDELAITIPSASDAPDDVRLERSVYNVNTRSDLTDARGLSEE